VARAAAVALTLPQQPEHTVDENNVVPINQNTEIQQPAVAAESGEAGAGAPAPAEPVAATDSHAAANAELAEKLADVRKSL
jgi:hypothetical protein